MQTQPQKQVNPPDLPVLFDQLKRDFMLALNCVKIGTIVSFDASTQTAQVHIAQKQVIDIADDGTRTLGDYPPMLECPVLFPCGGGFTLTFPLAPGDEVLVVFNDRELDNWLRLGAGLAPSTGRLHDAADGIVIAGLRSNVRALAGVSTTAAQLRSDDGTTYVEANADGLKLHAGKVYSWDCHGYGQKITWTGGSNYTIDNYVTGAVITTNNHAINPPVTP